MQQYNITHQQQQSKHSFQVKPIQPNHPIYMTSQSTQRQTGIQKISQSLDLKHISLLIVFKALIITLQVFLLFENRYFVLQDFKLLDFIFVTLLISIDFWVNKNIFGKQLAGLRWWVQLDEVSEEEEWVFQSADPNIEVHNLNNGFFWITNLSTALFWFVNFIIILIATNSLFWIGLCLFCLGTNLVNLICFYKCRGKHQKKLQQIIEKVGLKSATNLLSPKEDMKDVKDQFAQEQKFQIQ